MSATVVGTAPTLRRSLHHFYRRDPGGGPIVAGDRLGDGAPNVEEYDVAGIAPGHVTTSASLLFRGDRADYDPAVAG
jgi:hypothetical protein